MRSVTPIDCLPHSVLYYKAANYNKGVQPAKTTFEYDVESCAVYRCQSTSRAQYKMQKDQLIN